MLAVHQFKGPFRFLSNFVAAPINYEGQVYPTVEHAYQAAKTTNLHERFRVYQALTPGAAKRVGRHVTMRQNWHTIKNDVMLDLLRQKFSQPMYKRLLLDTGSAELTEGNTWGDTYWGVCEGKGMNKLGLLLMQVRKELRDE
mgnify:CR=1 FL=1